MWPMADKSTNKPRTKAAFEVIFAGHVEEGGRVMESKLQTPANDPAVVGQTFVPDRRTEAKRHRLDPVGFHCLNGLVNHVRDKSPGGTAAVTIRLDRPLTTTVIREADQKPFDGSRSLFCPCDEQAPAIPVRRINGAIKEADVSPLGFRRQAFRIDGANFVHQVVPVGGGIVLFDTLHHRRLMPPTIVYLTTDPLVFMTCPGQICEIQQRFFAPLGDLKSLVSEKR